MSKQIDLDQVRQYNKTLKEYKDKAVSLNAEIEYTYKEIDNLCAELSKELGTPVTRENIQQVYDTLTEQINNSLNSGLAVLNKIAQEQGNVSAQAQGNVAAQSQQMQQTQQMPQMQQMANPMAAGVQQQTPQQPQNPFMQQQPNSLFGQQFPVNNGQPQTQQSPVNGGSLPQMFSLS